MPLLPAGQERISSAAPDPGGSAAPLGTDTNSSRPSCPASYLGNQTQPSDVTGPLRSNQHRLSLLLSPPPSLRSPSPGRRRGGAVMPPPGHSVPAAPRPPCGALCPALELRPGSRSCSSPQRKGTVPGEEMAPPGPGPVGQGPVVAQVRPGAGISLAERGLCSPSSSALRVP